MQITNDEVAAAVEGGTVPERFAAIVAEHPDTVALRWREGDGWDEWTWAQYGERACRIAAGLGARGVGPGSRVVLMMRNRPDFHVTDMAVLLCGGTPISIYNSSSAEQIHHVVSHSGAMLAVVEDIFLDAFLTATAMLPAPIPVFALDSGARDGTERFDALTAATPVDLTTAASRCRPDDLATVIYTSGTTGLPKGVMLDHANVCWTVRSLELAMGDQDLFGKRVISYLPMAHIAERMVSHYLHVIRGFEVTTCPEMGMVAGYLGPVRPELLFAVPRVWEKMHAAITSLLPADPDRRGEFDAALDLGRRAAEYRARDEEMPSELAEQVAVAEAGTLGPVRQLLGLDDLLVAVTSAAPIRPDLVVFFRSLGFPLSELYGLSETSGPMTWDAYRVKPGTVGRAIPGMEVRLADDGEVLCRGGNIFRGYLAEPERTAEALDADAWFHTGDIGTFDDDGYLRIVDRKKELIITAGGKNISPANLETALKRHPLIGQAAVVGDGRPYVAALLVLDADNAPGWAAQHGIDAGDLATLAENPVVLAAVQEGVDEANADFSHAEGIKRWTLLPDEWIADSDELTPTMKLKRRGVMAKHADEIAALYA